MKHKKTHSAESKSRRTRNIAIALAGGLLALAAGWVMLRFSPRAYQPLPTENPEQVSPYLTHQLGPDFYNQVQLNEPFDLVIEQAGLNDMLGRNGWPQRFGEVTVFRPVVVFDKDLIYLMSRIEVYGFSSVLTLAARPQMDARGYVNFNIRSVRLGLVPITTIAARVAEKAVADSAAEFQDWPDLEAMFKAIVTNTFFEPTFDFGKQRIGLRSFSLEPGLLRLHLVPKTKAAQ